MFKTMFSIIAVLFVVGCANAQSLDEQVRTSTVVPDTAANGWKVFPEKEEIVYRNNVLTLKEEYYENTRDQMRVYLWVKDVNGNREELAMLYGTTKVARGAIKSGGRWHVSRYLYFDNGNGNPNGAVSGSAVYDEKEKDKPIKITLSLETIDGYREVVINLQ